MSPLGSQVFDMKTIQLGGSSNPFTKQASGFDKTVLFGTSDLIDKKAVLGGHDVTAPTLDFNKSFPISDTKLFQGASEYSSKTSDLTGKTSTLSADKDAPAQFSRILEEKDYQGRESTLIREAIDQMAAQSRDALHDEVSADAGGVNPAADKDKPHKAIKGVATIPVRPMISIDDVKALINKDVNSVSVENGSAGAAEKAAQQGQVPTPATVPAH
jgi:hypothetical protein